MYTVLTYHQEHMRGNLLQVELKIYRRTFINQKRSDSLVTRAPDGPSSSMSRSTKKKQKRAQTKRVGQKSRRRRQESRPMVRDRAIIGIHRVYGKTIIGSWHDNIMVTETISKKLRPISSWSGGWNCNWNFGRGVVAETKGGPIGGGGEGGGPRRRRRKRRRRRGRSYLWLLQEGRL